MWEQGCSINPFSTTSQDISSVGSILIEEQIAKHLGFSAAFICINLLLAVKTLLLTISLKFVHQLRLGLFLL